MVKAEDYAKLLPQAKEIIDFRLGLTWHLTYWVIPAASLISLGSGLGLTIYGLKEWKPRQDRDDEEQLRRMRKLKRELASSATSKQKGYGGLSGIDKPLSGTEQLEEISKKLDEAAKHSATQGQLAGADKGERVHRFNVLPTENQLQRAVHIRLNECFPNEHEVIPDRKFDKFKFDFILVPARSQEPEILIEITRFTGTNTLSTRIVELFQAMKHYKKRFDKMPRLRSFVLTDDEILNKPEFEKAINEFRTMTSLTDYSFAVMPVTLKSLSQLTCDGLRKFIEYGDPNQPVTYVIS